MRGRELQNQRGEKRREKEHLVKPEA